MRSDCGNTHQETYRPFSAAKPSLNVERCNLMVQSVIVDLMKSRVVGKLVVGAFLWPNQKLWSMLPSTVTRLRPMRAYGNFLHALARLRPVRMSHFYTFFFRNRPLLELARRLSDQKGEGSNLTITVLGCSIGAEVYSLLWTIRSRRPDLKVVVNAVDLSKEALEFARTGDYSSQLSLFTDAAVLAPVSMKEMSELFDTGFDQLTIKPWLKECIIWRVGDAADPRLLNQLGAQDMVLANNLLCHMYPVDAESCLRNIVMLVKPGGHLFISGIDLDVRAQIAQAVGLEPVLDLVEEIHNGDATLIKDWPFKYWGLEPFSTRPPDWRIRYSSAFRVKVPLSQPHVD
jgi:SAM-dependent methyltransferase